MKQLVVRLMMEGDRAQVVPLMVQLQEVERRLHPNRSPGEIVGDRHLAYLEKVVAEQEGQIFVAEQTGQIVGFTVCFVETIEEGDLHIAEAERRYGYISDLCVAPEMQGAGVGTALMQAVEQHFSTLGLTVMRLTALQNNEPAKQFYRAIGYEPYEVIYEKRIG